MTSQGEPLLLGRYRPGDLLRMLEEAGVLAALRERGFEHPAVCLVRPPASTLLHVELRANRRDREHLLLDACLQESTLALRGHAADSGQAHAERVPVRQVPVLLVHWLREQDPTAPFQASHPRLPLQDHPGLGVLALALDVAVRVASETGKQGVVALPKYFHDSVIFERTGRFRFADPAEQGRFEALVRDLSGLALADATLALAADAVTNRDGQLARWTPGLLVLALSPGVRAALESGDYDACRRTALESNAYRVDLARLEQARSELRRERRSHEQDQEEPAP